MASLQITNLFREPEGTVLFSTTPYRPVLDLLAHIETRDNLEEYEWRIAGRHGFMGGQRESGKRLPLPLEQIEAVLVQNAVDVQLIEDLIRSIAVQQSPPHIPKVVCQPSVLDVP